MKGQNKYEVVQRAVRWLLIMLLAEFVLGTALATVVSYAPGSRSGIQAGFLIAHIVVGLALLFGSLAHIFTSRSAHLLGAKPVVGFLCIVGAFASGVTAARDGSSAAVLVMALFFGAATITYGLSFLAVTRANLTD